MTQSGDPWTESNMKANNARHEAPVRSFLTALTSRPADHARFMNMLSMLEHMGSRKIMISQMDDPAHMTEDTLSHLAEEARHAYFFKRQARRIAGDRLNVEGFSDENVMCRVPALMYFGRLDAGISKHVPAKAAYPWVSLVVELRACWMYEIYQDVLEKSDIQLSLKSLLAEEDKHLADMFDLCGDDHDMLKKLSAYETTLFEKLWTALASEVQMDMAA
jgi:hypothetical protein